MGSMVTPLALSLAATERGGIERSLMCGTLPALGWRAPPQNWQRHPSARNFGRDFRDATARHAV
jgi:hypothetical protein